MRAVDAESQSASLMAEAVMVIATQAVVPEAEGGASVAVARRRAAAAIAEAPAATTASGHQFGHSEGEDGSAGSCGY